MAGLGHLDVSVAGESVLGLLVLMVHLKREGVLDVDCLDRVPTVVAQLQQRCIITANKVRNFATRCAFLNCAIASLST
jgi:hypothetical protein